MRTASVSLVIARFNFLSIQFHVRNRQLEGFVTPQPQLLEDLTNSNGKSSLTHCDIKYKPPKATFSR